MNKIDINIERIAKSPNASEAVLRACAQTGKQPSEAIIDLLDFFGSNLPKSGNTENRKNTNAKKIEQKDSNHG